MFPALASKHVDALERRLGVKLFHRSTRRLSLTEAGGNYLEACQRIFPDIDEAQASVASQSISRSSSSPPPCAAASWWRWSWTSRAWGWVAFMWSTRPTGGRQPGFGS